MTACGIAAADAGLEMYGLVLGAATPTTFVALLPELNQVTGFLSVASEHMTIDEDFNTALKKAKSLYPAIYDFFSEKAQTV